MGNVPPFGRVLVEQRKRRGMSRSELADAAELSYPYVSQLETGLRKPSRKAAEQLAVALGMDLWELESTIPTDLNDAASVQRAEQKSAAVLTRLGLAEAGAPAPRGRSFAAASTDGSSTPPSSREDLVNQLVDLIEEFDPDDRLDALAEVQKLVMKRMLSR